MTRPGGFRPLLTFGIRAVRQGILHRQICLRCGLPHCRRREREWKRKKTHQHPGRGSSGDRKKGHLDGLVLPRVREADGIINVVEKKLQGVEY